MHPNKRCSRSLARPNRTTPEYHDVDHGVVVGRLRRFCVIAPIAFVGCMGGWCCRTWCTVVFALVLRSVLVLFCSVCACSVHSRVVYCTSYTVLHCCHSRTLCYTILHDDTLSYTMIHYYTIIHCYTLVYTIVHCPFLIVGGKLAFG